MLMIVTDTDNDEIIRFNITKEEVITIDKFLSISNISTALYLNNIDIDFIPDEDIKKF